MKYTDYNDAAEKQLIGRARELQPLLRKAGPQQDIDRRISDDVFRELTDAGFWEMASPRRWGGLGTSATCMARVGAELGKGDPSVGWVYTVLHGTTWVASLGPDELQEAVFGNGKHPTICGAVSPPGEAAEVDGGYTRQADSAVVQGQLGKIFAQVTAARLLMEKTCAQIDSAGLTMTPMTPMERAQSKGEGSFTIDLLAEACNDLMFLAGPIGSAFKSSKGRSHCPRPIST